MKKNRAMGIACVLIALVYGAMVMQLPKSNMVGDPGPKVFPLVGTALLLIAGTLLIVQNHKITPDHEEKAYMTVAEWKRMGVLYGIYILYGVLLYLLGFVIAMPIILFAVSTLFAEGKKIAIWKRALFSVVTTVIIYLLFTKAMSMPLYSGILFK